MNKIRIVIIGSGWVTENRHIPALLKNKNFEITAVVGKDENKVRLLAKKYKIKMAYFGDATKNTKWLEICDAVMIGIDPLNHHKVAKFCLNHGKHVLMEKPLTVLIKDSEDLVKIANKSKLKFGIVHNFQFSDSSKKLDKELISGKLGKLKVVFAFQFGNPKRRLPSWYEKLPWGLFFDESPHLLYLLDKYAKGISLVNATKFNSSSGMQTPASVIANFKTNLGVPASIYLNFESPLSEWYLLVIGEKRFGILDVFRDTYYSLPNDGAHKAFDILRTTKKNIIEQIKGTVTSGFKVIRKDYLCGNEKIVDLFANAVLKNSNLSPISIIDAYRINKLQFEIMNKAEIVK